MQILEFTTYGSADKKIHLDKLGNGQIIDHYKSIKKFIQAFTTASKPTSTRIDYHPSKKLCSYETSLLHETEQKYGNPYHRSDIDEYSWILPTESTEEAIIFLSEKQFSRMPFSLEIKYEFGFIDPTNRRLLKGQGNQYYSDQVTDTGYALGHNSITIYLSQPSYAKCWLTLPWPINSKEFKIYSDLLAKEFPCKLSPQQWKSWKLSKKNKRYYYRNAIYQLQS